MKHLFFIISLIFFPTIHTFGQFAPIHQELSNYTALDTAQYIVTYKVETVSDPSKPDKKISDEQVLQVGKHVSKTFSNLLFKGDSTYTASVRKGARSAPWFQELVSPVEVYKNLPKGKLTITHRTFLSGPIFKYDEPDILFHWKLLPDRKKIFSYNCQKATTEFRGRTYEAWFTPEIPLKEGPYKFGELPGLILEISDTQKHYVYTCIGLERPKRVVLIKFWKWRYQETNRIKMKRLLQSFYKNPSLFFESTGIKYHGDTKSMTFPYNPIELE